MKETVDLEKDRNEEPQQDSCIKMDAKRRVNCDVNRGWRASCLNYVPIMGGLLKATFARKESPAKLFFRGPATQHHIAPSTVPPRSGQERSELKRPDLFRS